jgi:hypothetical protein
MPRLLLALTLVGLLTALFGAAPVAAADGDNLRQIIIDRTGTNCASVNAAGNHSSVGVGIAFDGVSLLASCYSDNTITENSPADGSLVAVHNITGVSSLGALAWDNGRGLIWACGNFATIGTISLVTNVFTPVFNPVGGCFDGLAYDGADDTLWSGFDANDQLDHSTTAGVHLATYTPGITRSGIAVGGDLLYLANNGGQQIYRAPKDVSSVTLFASFPSRLEDLECDNLTFAASGKAAIWSIDAYDNIVNAWEIPFGSCLFGGGPGQLTLTPGTAENPVGASHMVTAHLRDLNGPIANATILFSVSGANTAAGSGTTDVNGEATFTYTGTNAGTDTITACWDENTNGVCDTTESTATATKVWAGAGPPANLVLEPETATNVVGNQHCLTATVTDANGTPTPGITVDFAVSGPNGPLVGAGVTDANGVAQFCYTGTHVGDDTITATAVGGTNPSDSATKTWTAGPPFSLTLLPETANNTVDEQHCVTATVVDAFGNPTPGITVRFSVTGPGATSGSATTNAAGVAEFCYSSALPGSDTITAYADTNNDNVNAPPPDEPEDSATKTWNIPASDADCQVTLGGWITTSARNRATFGGNADGAGPAGEQEYQDHGTATGINVHSINVQSVTCSPDGTTASIFGTATIDGAGSFDFRIDVVDNGNPGSTDRYRIRLSNGYDSGSQQLGGGNIVIH